MLPVGTPGERLGELILFEEVLDVQQVLHRNSHSYVYYEGALRAVCRAGSSGGSASLK